MSKTMYLPDGTQGHNISCGGMVLSSADCFQKAGELCGSRGYALLNWEGEAIPFNVTTANASASPGRAQGAFISQAGTAITRSIFVRCNNESAGP